MPILQISQGKLPVSLEWAYMTRGAFMSAYAYLIAFVLFAFWVILILAKTNELLREIKDEICLLNEKLGGVIKGKATNPAKEVTQ